MAPVIPIQEVRLEKKEKCMQLALGNIIASPRTQNTQEKFFIKIIQ